MDSMPNTPRSSSNSVVPTAPQLRSCLVRAVEMLGAGLVSHEGNQRLRSALTSGALTPQSYYRQLLQVVYRLVFVFVAEDRELLHPPDAQKSACDRYRSEYATLRIRDLAASGQHAAGTDLWNRVGVVFDALADPNGSRELGLPHLGSLLWDPDATPDVSGSAKASDRLPTLLESDKLLEAMRCIACNSSIEPIDFRSIGFDPFGSIYESLLELVPDLDVPSGAFSLRPADQSERKTSGSYYTPDSLVHFLLDAALEPLVDDRLLSVSIEPGADRDAHRGANEQAILDITVCDPACGSGHFLVAAASRLADRLQQFRARVFDRQKSLRDVIRNCIFGVDINPMAVELCKAALWFEYAEPGTPLSFLDHHIRVGNALLGATPELIAAGIPDDTFKALDGSARDIASFFRKRNNSGSEAHDECQHQLPLVLTFIQLQWSSSESIF